ncbi:translocation/assembly module TamB domain-containing protein [Chachezhania sediminis]|uniref:translocation/assembly module TamB domain-containing protein n=1 Tax=Chachezhania sediminis TaxID=2599291 RepID=UPI00131A6216|nr:translocation/assembly module TamB domain-containing protein [Chachezhania sediminis]
MRQVSRVILVCSVVSLTWVGAGPIGAQSDGTAGSDDDAGGFLVRMLENLASGENRSVRVIGLSGALSSHATIQRITVADDDGVWLTLENVVLDWNRLALVRRRFSVNELSAESINVARLPGEVESETEIPTAEAQPFTIPELPVAVNIAKIATQKLTLAQPVAGVAATLDLDGSFALADGGLSLQMKADRLDRQGDKAKLIAAYVPQGQQITLDISLDEAPGGLISTAMSIPGAPSVTLTAKGEGPVEDFKADISLATDGEQRLGGTVLLSRESATEQTGSTQRGIGFVADLGGDLTALLAEPYQPFFGTDTALHVTGVNQPGGNLKISEAEITSQSLNLQAQLATTDGRLSQLQAKGRIAPQDGSSVVLPAGSPPLSIAGADLTVALGDDEKWTAQITATGIAREDIKLAQIEVSANGTLGAPAPAAGVAPDPDAEPLRGSIEASLTGLDLNDEALDIAIGDTVQLTGDFEVGGQKTVQLQNLNLKIDDYGLTGNVGISSENGGMVLDGTADVDVPDLSRFAKLAGQPLDGAATLTVTGSAAPMAASYSGTVKATTTDLDVGIAELKELMKGRAALDATVERDTTGTRLRNFSFDGTGFSTSASGVIQTGATQLKIDASLDDLGRVLPAAPGPVSLSGNVQQEREAWTGDLTLTAPNDSTLKVTAQVPPTGAAQIAADGRIGALPGLLPEDLTPILIDGQAARPAANAADWNGDLSITAGDGVTARLNGTVDTLGNADLTLDSRVDASAGLLPDDFAPTTLAGTMKRDPQGVWQTDLAVAAARAVVATLTGQVTETGTAALKLSGELPYLDDKLPAALTPVTLSGTANRAEDGSMDAQVTLDADAGGVADLTATMDADGLLQAQLNGQVASGSGLVPPELEPVTLSANARRRDGVATAQGELQGGKAGRLSFVANHSADNGASVSLTGAVQPIDGMIPSDFAPVAIKADAATKPDGGWAAEAHLSGAERAVLHVNGKSGTDGLVQAEVKGNVSLKGEMLPPSMSPINLDGTLQQTRAGGWTTRLSATSPFDSYLRVDGSLNQDMSADISYDARLNRFERLIQDFTGTVASKGTASMKNNVWQINADTTGPGGITSDLRGSYDVGRNVADITTQGELPLAIANIFVSPNSVAGRASYRLRLAGKPAIESLAGTITTSGASAAAPEAGQLVEDISATITIANGSAVLASSASLGAGGSVSVRGPVSLTAPYNAQIVVLLNELGLTNQLNVESSASGQISVNGPLLGGAQIVGTVNFGETNIDLGATTGGLSLAPIPDIIHVGQSAAVQQTLVRANLVRDPNAPEGPPVVYGLNVTLNAPNRVFVRGRGVDAELGGSLHVGGTTANMVPSGQIGLIRGVVDVLGRPLRLTRGNVSLRGSFDPYIEFAATTNTSEGSATLTIEGSLDSPEITVTSVPERPRDEALAMLVFGSEFSDISPLRLAQMAASLARAGGITGGGVTEKVREETGVDTLRTGNSGGIGSLTTGGYIANNVYTDVTVNAEGNTELDLNLDLTNSVTLRGRADNTGNTALGIFYERDY